MLDIIIKNGIVIDGISDKAEKKDVGIINDKIVFLGVNPDAVALKVIDATGLMVTPGFIDVHTHSDEAVLINPLMESKIRQGVTTEVIGNCGSSAAPLSGEVLKHAEKSSDLKDTPISWRSMGEYLDLVEKQGSSTNIISLTGHGNIRGCVLGYEMKFPSQEEQKIMNELLEASLREGSWGLSTGLIYPPSAYAQTDEIIELAKIVAKYDGVYATHMRNETDKLLDAVEETITIAQNSQVKTQIAHHKVAGKKNWGMVVHSLSMIAKARNSGLEVTCDQYPYIAASTGLSSRVPDWAHDGGLEKMVDRLKNKETYELILENIRERMPEKYNYEAVLIGGCPSDKSLEGLNLWQISQLKDLPPAEIIIKLLIENNGMVEIVSFGMCEEDVKQVMQAPFVMVGSDASAKAIYGPLATGKPHPRAYGTFPRVLGKYSRDEKVISLAEAIRKMTSLPAQTYGLSKRGVLTEGNYADVVTFSADKIIDKATYIEPHQYPEGINYVLVNGKIVLDNEQHLGTKSGKILRRKHD